MEDDKIIQHGDGSLNTMNTPLIKKLFALIKQGVAKATARGCKKRLY